LKLKDGIYFEFDSETRNYKFDFSNAKVKKVTSRAFPILLGKNQYNSIGYGVLERCGFIDFEPIEKWYTVRGAIAEQFAYDYILETYKKYGIDIKMKAMTPQMFKGYDAFPNNEKFGGVPDIGISEPKDQRAVIEVKSKNIKKYDELINNTLYPIEEVLQGKQLAYLSKTNKLLMVWVFFTDKQENLIKEVTNKIKNADDFDVSAVTKHIGLSYQDVKIAVVKFNINEKETLEKMETAYNNLHTFIELGKIDEKYFYDTELLELKRLLGIKTVDDPDTTIPPLPF